MSALGNRIRELRKRKGLTQEWLARRAEMSTNTLAKLEQGGIQDPHYSTLCAIARGLGISLIELLLIDEEQEEALHE